MTAVVAGAPPGSGATCDDARAGQLSPAQRLAAGCSAEALFIEAGPGTGKTTVAAHRFGVVRFSPDVRMDPRPVVAVSFTRAATWNLRRRIRRFYGPSATAWPHRVVTLDTVMCDLLHHLLTSGHVQWPGALQTLKVEDSWSILGETFHSRQSYTLSLTPAQGRLAVAFGVNFEPEAKQRPDVRTVKEQLRQGTCTHEDVRQLVAAALAVPALRDVLRLRLSSVMRALIVDECFDANDLDVDVIALAREAGVALTLVGDPWQALYQFRGATPDLVRELISTRGFRTLPLSESFRWRSQEQKSRAVALRDGRPTELPHIPADALGAENVDVVLATEWKPLWELGQMVLPLAFGGFKGTAPEAAATILLNHVTRSILSEDATYLGDALTALAMTPEDPRRLEGELARVLDLLKQPGRPAAAQAWSELVGVLAAFSPRYIKPAHWRYTDRLQLVAQRLVHEERPVAGLTTHQAKGREWDVVGLRLTEAQLAHFAAGLRQDDDTCRKLYVAATRARARSVVLDPPPQKLVRRRRRV